MGNGRYYSREEIIHSSTTMYDSKRRYSLLHKLTFKLKSVNRQPSLHLYVNTGICEV